MQQLASAPLLESVRQQTPAASDPDVMRQPVSMLLIGVTSLLFFAGVIVTAIGNPNLAVRWWICSTFSLCSLWAVYVICEYFLERHKVSPAGLEFGGAISGKGLISWRYVARVEYNPHMRWFRLETRAGAPVRITMMLSGLPRFAALLLANVPPESIDPAARPLLADIAAGHTIKL